MFKNVLGMYGLIGLDFDLDIYEEFYNQRSWKED